MRNLIVPIFELVFYFSVVAHDGVDVALFEGVCPIPDAMLILEFAFLMRSLAALTNFV